MKTLWHITTADRLPLIKTAGLQPRSEKRGLYSSSDTSGVYLFSDPATAEDALMNWMADEIPQQENTVVLLAVDVDGLALEDDPELAGSFIARDVISPTRIRIDREFQL